MAAKQPRVTLKEVLNEFIKARHGQDELAAIQQKLCEGYAQRLREVVDDLDAGRVSLARAKLTQLVEAYDALGRGEPLDRDPWA